MNTEPFLAVLRSMRDSVRALLRALRILPYATTLLLLVCWVVYLASAALGLLGESAPLSSLFSVAANCLIPDQIQQLKGLHRIVAANFIHASLGHILLNSMALVHYGAFLEQRMGSVLFLWCALLFAPLVSIIHVLLAGFVDVLLHTSWSQSCSVGFSAVLFAFIVIEVKRDQHEHRMPFTSYTYAASLHPWVLLLVGQVLLGSSASFLGHLSGILVGYLYNEGFLTRSCLLPPESLQSCIELLLPESIYRSSRFFSHAAEGLPTFSTGLSLGAGYEQVASGVPTQSDMRFPGRGHILGNSSSTLPPISRTETETPVDKP
ncbi:uncharacterized protein BJ171DRAFT_518984 [Polychytrium aggregatum]|uniref:uncharacterized protein n=1 Tax=Polychytrium aggregatum TaxID=110093 RepID=UPI0022FEAECC|nr:uncharacterized protein BJ171DRAFT_518984 [Polychytrium aggregatum]KAI9199380.1 hypothetical protein BJ171DRAFT_518984 [Polychytrium aggregatum]